MTTERILPFLLLLTPFLATAPAQGPSGLRHIAIFDANLAQFTEERNLQLQAGTNNIEWRSLMPGAIPGTLRVTADQAMVLRQGITLDGADVRGQKTAVLHLTLQSARTPTRNSPTIWWNSSFRYRRNRR